MLLRRSASYSNLFRFIQRNFSKKFFVENFDKKAIDCFNSVAINVFRGRIDSNQIFPYPNLLNKEQRESLKKLVKPIEQFFYEFGKKSSVNDEDAFKKLWQLGAFSMQVPKHLGGLGLSNTQYARLVEIVGAHDLGVGITLGAHQSLGYKGILLHGTEQQKRKYLAKVTNGQLAAFCLTEPGCGSDICSMTTQALLSADKKHYLLTGCKFWIASRNGNADIMTVFAKTLVGNTKKPWENITAFIVEKSFPGITTKRIPLKDDDNHTTTVQVTFDNVQVPAENVLGLVGDGYKIAMDVLNNGRFGMAASLAGTMRSCTNKAIQFVTNQNLFGEKMNTYCIVQEKLARMALFQYVTESMAYVLSSYMDKGSTNYSMEAAISKCFASDAAWYVCDEAIQIMGGTGYLKDNELEGILKDLRTFRIFEGTNDVLKLYIALTGIQYAVPPVEEMKKALKSPVQNYEFIMRELISRGLCTTGMKTFFKLRNACNFQLWFPAYLVGRCMDSFSLCIIHVIVTQGKELDSQQFILNKIAECAIDIYASTCVLSRANNAITNKLPTAQYETKLATMWIKQSTRRIMGNVRDVIYKRQAKYFKNFSDISKKICDNGKIPTNNPLNL